jgi:ubiquinol-cytochrome c reductase cytochrome c subunit
VWSRPPVRDGPLQDLRLAAVPASRAEHDRRLVEEERRTVATRPPSLSRAARLGRSVAGLVVIVAVGSVAVLALVGSRPAAGAAPGATTPGASLASSVQSGGDIAAGRGLYIQTCAACHGVTGQGVPGQGPSLQGQGAAGAAYALYTGRMPLPENGVPSLQRNPILTPAQIQSLVDYVARIAPGPTIPPVDTQGADISAGRQIFINNCAACHGADAAGGSVGGGFVAPSLHQASASTIGSAMVTGPGPMPVFALPIKQIDEVAAYIRFLQTAPTPGGISLGGLGPVPEGFVAAAIGLALLLVLVNFVARRPRG